MLRFAAVSVIVRGGTTSKKEPNMENMSLRQNSYRDPRNNMDYKKYTYFVQYFVRLFGRCVSRKHINTVTVTNADCWA